MGNLLKIVNSVNGGWMEVEVEGGMVANVVGFDGEVYASRNS